MNRIKILLALLLLCFASIVKANNVQIGPVTSTVTGTTTTLSFNVSWENSWRGGPANNWDALWIFCKYKDDNGDWSHLDINAPGLTVGTPLNYSSSSDKKGFFLFRGGDGIGNIATTPITVGVKQKPGSYDVKVFAMEMVYIPAGAFYLGYNGGTNTYGNGSSSQAYLTGNLTMGTQVGQLYDPRGMGTFNGAYPGGGDGFYIMKYELSQGGYRDFLNTLPANSSLTLPERSDLTSANYTTVGTRLFPTGFRNNLVVASSSGLIGTDANNNSVFNEPDDGEWIAANYLLWSDCAAFLDWACLRPMTETEYEKASYGPDIRNNPYFASGTNLPIPLATPIINANTSTEAVTKTTVSNYINSSEMGINGPLRCGFAADATSNRLGSAGSYYGVMELSGNLWEPVVTTSNKAGRSFSGNAAVVLGDGSLSLNGRANQYTWPGNGNNNPDDFNVIGEIAKYNTAGITMKGGSFAEPGTASISTNLYDPATFPITRANAKNFGCRGVRQMQ